MGGGCKASLLTASCTSHRGLLLLLTPLRSTVEAVFLAFHLRLVGGGLTLAAAELWLDMSSCTEFTLRIQSALIFHAVERVNLNLIIGLAS